MSSVWEVAQLPTPRHGYSLNGKQVPGVTTIVGRYKEGSALMKWAWSCGLRHIDYNLESSNAAKIGTAAHDAIERHIKGVEQEKDPVAYYELPAGGMEKARRCFEAWKVWNDAVRPQYVSTETQLVNPEHAYGGTIDAIGKIGESLVLLDWKTSKAIHDETAMQIAAYKHLWYANGGEHIDHCRVIRFDKSSGSFEQLSLTDTSDYFEQFLDLLRAYKRGRRIFPVPWERMTKRELLKTS